MASELHPDKQETRTETGQFGETEKGLYQDHQLMAYRSFFNETSMSHMQIQEEQDRFFAPTECRSNPKDSSFTHMDLGGHIYSMGDQTKEMCRGDNTVSKNSKEYLEIEPLFEKAAKSLNFDSPEAAASDKLPRNYTDVKPLLGGTN